MIVMKFGGTSVGSRERLQEVARLVAAGEGPRVVVVSAMGGTTDVLLAAGHDAAAGALDEAMARVDALGARHAAAAARPDDAAELAPLFEELRSLLRGLSLVREQTPRTRALLSSFGERLSVPLATGWLRGAGLEAVAVDARTLVRTDERFLEGRVDLPTTRARCRAALLPRLEAGETPVVTGFLGSTDGGETTVLGRSGSDYTAALLGQVLDADEVEIWTDVDGILSADPRIVPEARTLSRVSYREAAEMSYFGAKVVHPKTMTPCEEGGIPLRIRSTFAPTAPGTLISGETESVPHGVKTVTSLGGLAMVTVAGRGMAGLPGVARRIFEAAEVADVSIRMISQASSEQTVSVVVGSQDGAALEAELQRALALEIEAGWITAVELRDRVAVLSIIGEGMAGTSGVSGRLFGALGATGVNVLAIAQGGRELSISVALDADAVARGVRAVHTAFGLTRTVHLVLIGRGRVARSFVDMLDGVDAAAVQRAVGFRVVAVAGSRAWRFDPHGLPLDGLLGSLDSAGEPRPDDASLVARVAAERLTDVVLVDLSAAPLQGLHLAALEAGMHVVTANKVPLSGDLASYRELVRARDAARVRYGYETTFGAGLPALHTLKDLLATGDELRRVSGCFSGTLGFLCTRLQEGRTLAEAVEEAAALGYTEPDPREDLSGRDVARKALIIARAVGLPLEPDDVVCAPFVEGLDAGLEEALAARGPALAQRFADAQARGATLRYVAVIEGGGAQVGLEEVPLDSPIGSLLGPDNILVFTTRRYDRYPLVIRGPGAGAEVTAAGVLGDLLRITG